MKEQIENSLKKLKTQQAQLDGEIRNAQQFLQQAVPEMNGIIRAIIELEALLKPVVPESTDETKKDK